MDKVQAVWLIFLELIVNNFVWYFDPSYSLIVLQVIWAIGFGMLFLSGIIYLSNKILSVFTYYLYLIYLIIIFIYLLIYIYI